MTGHYFENELVNLHYYKFGNGHQPMLCFHGYGMHGKQFKILEPLLGEKYTFFGFDLFFHKETKLKDQSLPTIKKGISKKQLADFFLEFCLYENITRFSVIGYSMGTHYATIMVEELPQLIDEYIVAAPSALRPGALITFFGKYRIGNKIMEKMVLHEKALLNMLKLFRQIKLINDESYKILFNEIGTTELRFNFYACFTYLRFLGTDKVRLTEAFNEHSIQSIFIFGKRDKAFPPGIGKSLIGKLNKAKVVILDEGHDMIKREFAAVLTKALL